MTTKSRHGIRCAFCEEQVEWNQVQWTTLVSVTGYICKDCIEDVRKELGGATVIDKDGFVAGEDDAVPWWKDQDYWDGVKGSGTAGYGAEVVGKYLATMPGLKYFKGKSKGPAKPILPMCVHNLTPFIVTPEVTVHLSGSRGLTKPVQGPLPDVGVYLDETWNPGYMWVNDGSTTKADDHIVSAFVNWPDFGAISIEVFLRALAWTMKKIEEGKVVEVGCMGGHGRTGTFAAGLMIAYGSTAKEARQHVWTTYCTKAIENKKQEDLLDDLEDAFIAAELEGDDDVDEV